ncbi:TetR family transcriptional regulator [Nocardia sp. XZ_19_385]|uniref:TetR/AcrR family transcriptional regulator n=1 Tax=Nocardia sp. XZ_19_385 TaxID=2769488 RepID=UPI00188EF9A9|nr:TetR family transcriptional regulator [Nocardia sp. XZ_19_385]
MAPIGRRPGKNDTRDVLVRTARRMFADTGFDKTSVRDIAAAAGVDPGLIRHYFGSKADLFQATLGWPFDPAAVAAQVTAEGPGGVGARLTRVFFEAWEHPESRSPLLAILRGAATHADSADLVRQFIQGELYDQLAARLPGPDAGLRIDLAMAQLLGVAYLRHILRVEPLASASVDELVTRVSPVVEAHLNATP